MERQPKHDEPDDPDVEFTQAPVVDMGAAEEEAAEDDCNAEGPVGAGELTCKHACSQEIGGGQQGVGGAYLEGAMRERVEVAQDDDEAEERIEAKHNLFEKAGVGAEIGAVPEQLSEVGVSGTSADDPSNLDERLHTETPSKNEPDGGEALERVGASCPEASRRDDTLSGWQALEVVVDGKGGSGNEQVEDRDWQVRAVNTHTLIMTRWGNNKRALRPACSIEFAPSGYLQYSK